MRQQKIVRIVDALAAQQRVILWLKCEHKVSLDARLIMADEKLYRKINHSPTHWDCPFCPDPPPEDPQAAKTPQQLYKEAGEP